MNIPAAALYLPPLRLCLSTFCAALCFTSLAWADNQLPSALVSKRTEMAAIKFTIRLAGDSDPKACREWMGRMFGEVSETRETTRPGGSVALILAAEKRFAPPFKEADELHAAVPASPCGKGVLSVSVTQSLTADEARRNLKAL